MKYVLQCYIEISKYVMPHQETMYHQAKLKDDMSDDGANLNQTITALIFCYSCRQTLTSEMLSSPSQ